MLDINNPVQWQVKDTKYPTLMPWFTSGMLEEIKTWDLSGKVVLEWGGGWSSVFWAYYSKQVYTVETNTEWVKDIYEYFKEKEWDCFGFLAVKEEGDEVGMGCKKDGKEISIYSRTVNEGDQAKVDYYTEIPNGCKPNIVVIDGVLRHECLLRALTLPRPLTIIHDNWKQDGFICPASEELMEQYKEHSKVYVEEAHTDNHGNKWSTAVWHLPA